MSQIAGKIAKRDLTAVQRVLPLYHRTKQMTAGAIFKAKEGTMKIPMISNLFSRELGLEQEMKVNHVTERTPIDSLNEKLEQQELASSESATQTEGEKKKRRKSLTDIIFGSK